MKIYKLDIQSIFENTYIFSTSPNPEKAPLGMILILVRKNILKAQEDVYFIY